MRDLLIYTTLAALLACAAAHAQDQDGVPTMPPGFAAAEVEAVGQTFRYVRGGEGETVVLLHGWPQTSEAWTQVMPLLGAAGYDVIALDLPGIGASTNPDGDFSKASLARDVRALLTALDVERAHVVGHDIGAMIAYAHAAQFPDATLSLTYIDAPLPGTQTFDQVGQDPRTWYFGFHNAPEAPEALVTGREEFYLPYIMREFEGEPGALDDAEVGAAVRAYRDPGTLRAGFEWYRAFGRDAEDNAVFIATPLVMPVLALNGDAHTGGKPFVLQMLQPLAVEVTGGLIAGSGHWIPEEQPEALAEALLAHFHSVTAR